MKNIYLRVTESGHWITNWLGKDHHVSLNTIDELDFLTMGLIDLPPVRFGINLKGDILSVVDNRTDRPLTELGIPVNHFLHRDLNIGKPYVA